MPGRLAGQLAIVTGGGYGIGRGIALRFAEEGADVLVADIDVDNARETARMIRDLGRRAETALVDVSQRAAVERILDHTVSTLGRAADILVNNAGVIPTSPFFEVTDEEWDRCLAINLKGPFLCTQVMAREWVRTRTRGRVVNIASVESAVARLNQVPYGSSKGGLLMLTRATALELAPYGIRVNAVGPGAIRPGHGYFDDPARLEAVRRRTPLQRVGLPRDVAHAAVFLASAESDYVTGSIVYVDGGVLIQ